MAELKIRLTQEELEDAVRQYLEDALTVPISQFGYTCIMDTDTEMQVVHVEIELKK